MLLDGTFGVLTPLSTNTRISTPVSRLTSQGHQSLPGGDRKRQFQFLEAGLTIYRWVMVGKRGSVAQAGWRHWWALPNCGQKGEGTA